MLSVWVTATVRVFIFPLLLLLVMDRGPMDFLMSGQWVNCGLYIINHSSLCEVFIASIWGNIFNCYYVTIMYWYCTPHLRRLVLSHFQEDPTLERHFKGHRDTVTSLDFNPNMKQLGELMWTYPCYRQYSSHIYRSNLKVTFELFYGNFRCLLYWYFISNKTTFKYCLTCEFLSSLGALKSTE